MKCVYSADNNVLANLALHQLQMAEIPAKVLGEYLQGGIGELPPLGLIRVVVPEDYEQEALDIIAGWEQDINSNLMA
jgi:hypothetical protein